MFAQIQDNVLAFYTGWSNNIQADTIFRNFNAPNTSESLANKVIP